MNWPPSRAVNSQITAGWCSGIDPSQVPQNGTCLWFNQGCSIGCSKCTGNTSGCTSPMEPTNNDMKYRTYQNYQGQDITRTNPWRAPGFSPIESPCGLAGGWYTPGKPGNGGIPPRGVKQGFDGRKWPATEPRYKWKKGTSQEVSWSVHANHGGGYQYRLCPVGSDLTEECFQKNPLKFTEDVSYIQYGKNLTNRTSIPALTLSVGTNPKGSQWRRNPIPACSGPYGGSLHSAGCDKPQFEPTPLPGLYGFGLGRCGSGLPGKDCPPEEHQFWAEKFNFNMIDMVEVPTNLPDGDYVLSFRWDCEQTPQIWAICSDITLTS